MTKTGYKNIFIALLLLAFTSQSFAGLLMPCQFASQASHSMDMDNMAGMNHSDMASMNHSDMASMDHSDMPSMNHSDMPSMNHSDMASMGHLKIAGDIKTDTTPTSNCCKTVGHCSSGSCSLAIFGDSFVISLLSTHADANIFYTNFVPESLISSLFRPPIFR